MCKYCAFCVLVTDLNIILYISAMNVVNFPPIGSINLDSTKVGSSYFEKSLFLTFIFDGKAQAVSNFFVSNFLDNKDVHVSQGDIWSLHRH